MSNKKNLPNIPIYIGDWERDCNVLSLESEAAWLRIIFKLWTKGKQNSIKIPTKALQNLWRCSEEKMTEILNELTYNEIAEISIDSGFVEFTCRRFVKENKISKIRSKASKSNKLETKDKQNLNKTQSKHKQITDYANENDNEYVIKSDNIFLKEICNYFSQTTEVLKMRVNTFLNSLLKLGKFDEFKTQTEAYMKYKKVSGEQIHRWNSYSSEWENQDWVNMLKKLKSVEVTEMGKGVKDKLKKYA